MKDVTTYTSGNRLVDALPATERAELTGRLEMTAMRSGQITHAPQTSYPWVVFPIDAVLSVVWTTLAGETCEVGTIGNEGASGVDVAYGAPVRRTTFCQIAGSVATLRVDDFLETSKRFSTINAAICASEHARSFFVEQLVVCNTMHRIEQRCARWILAMSDRRRANKIYITHEYLSYMLGVRRPSVSIAESSLQKAGAISMRRGTIEIADRALLESLACECYVATAAVFDESIAHGEASPKPAWTNGFALHLS